MSVTAQNNGKNNATAVGLCAVFVVSWWRNKGLHTLNRMYNEVWVVRKFNLIFHHSPSVCVAIREILLRRSLFMYICEPQLGLAHFHVDTKK